MPATIAAAQGGRHDRRVGRRAARGVRRLPRADRRRRRGRRRGDDELLARAARRGRRGVRGARPPAQDPRRQARPRRALQRRRADRRARPRRRHGGRLRGHPPDARRRSPPRRGDEGVARGRPLDPLRLAPRADPRRRRGCCASAGVDVPGRRRRDHPRGRRRARCARPASPRVYTPKDFDLNRIMGDIVELVSERAEAAATQPA